jgi:hypothetical protein
VTLLPGVVAAEVDVVAMVLVSMVDKVNNIIHKVILHMCLE